MSAGNLGQTAEPIDEPPAQAPSSIAAAKKDGEELLVIAGVGPETLEAAIDRITGSLPALEGKADGLRGHRRRG